MIATGDPASHHEAWLALPWLASGRLSQNERDKIEPHVHSCTACRDELAFQRLLCTALTEPDRVTYAPGPSFRKLMDRIDGTAPQGNKPPARVAPEARPAPIRARKSGSSLDSSALWRPPGLAWAASFILMIGLAGVMTSLHRSAQAPYRTHSDPAATPTDVLHIAFQRTVTIDEVNAVLRSTQAHVVEGPDSVGIFGVAPGLETSGKVAPERISNELRVLSARLRADPRVRWVEPYDSPADAASRGH